ncbi:tyrosine decarboxylase [Trichonephila clavipes]|nr:tyrosine decarboxylase [Trichonephila clavipes]
MQSLPGNGGRKLYMQIKVHDVKNQKKEIRAEIGMLQKRLFYCRNCEIRLRSIFFLRQGYLRMSQQRDLPESIAWRVIGRLKSGQTQRGVADAVGVARSVVARLWNRLQETGNVRRRPGAGRPRATTSTDDRYIQLTARRNRTENATQLQRQLLLATGRRVSSQTVRNRLHEGGLYARRPMVCIPLTPCPRAARRRWAAEHRDWKQHDWSQVLFTDESLFSPECDTRRVLVWRDRGTRNNPAFVRERSQYRRAGWMVWGGISIGGRTDLHIIRNGTLTGRSARLVETMLEAETIQRMELPACSPDLNQSSMFGTCPDDALLRDQGRLLLSETWRLHFLRSGTVTHWQHPRFHAYFPAGNAYPSILADMLSDAIGCVGFSWAASPACTELETIMLDWLGKMIGLPEDFLCLSDKSKGGGVIQGSASDCILVNLLAARHSAVKALKQEKPFVEEGTLLSSLMAYCSKEVSFVLVI